MVWLGAMALRNPANGLTMNPDIERLCRALIDRIGSPWPWDEMPPEVRTLWIGHVEAILSELRKPSSNMRFAGQQAWSFTQVAETKVWQAMLDSITEEDDEQDKP